MRMVGLIKWRREKKMTKIVNEELEARILKHVGHTVKVTWLEGEETCCVAGYLERVDLSAPRGVTELDSEKKRYLSLRNAYAWIKLESVQSIESWPVSNIPNLP